MQVWIVSALAASALVIARPLLAHHAISAHYDRSRSVTVGGEVIDFLLRNPHSQMRMRVEDAAGVTAVWTLEMDDVEDIVAQGIDAESFQAGDVIIATGNPARDGSAALFARSIRRPADGLQYYDD